MHEIPERITLSDGRHQRLGARQDVRDVRPAQVGDLRDLTGRANQPPIGSVALDDAGVMLHPDRSGQLRD